MITLAPNENPELPEIQVICPYCGETFDTLVDCSADEQMYYEDCQICCRPILFSLDRDIDQNILVILRTDDE